MVTSVNVYIKCNGWVLNISNQLLNECCDSAEIVAAVEGIKNLSDEDKLTVRVHISQIL